MMGSEVLDVLIGLAVVFFMLSLMAAAVREAVEAFWKSRAVFLERGIRELLNDPDGSGITRDFYRHPLIASLFDGEFVEKKVRWRGKGMPSYIPSRNFALAIMDVVLRPEQETPYAVARATSAYTIEDLRGGVARLDRSPFLQRAMLSAIDGAYGNIERVHENLKEWFDSSMDRVSGKYKRRTHLHLFIIGVALTAALNVDALALANHLWRNKAAREALVKRADLILADSAYIKTVRDTSIPDSLRMARLDTVRARYNDLASLNLPITWTGVSLPTANDRPFLWWTKTILGFLLTAAAITLGAPFWFDLLNKMMVIRSTVKPREKSQEEGSEDKKTTTPKSAATALAPTMPSAPTQPPTAALPAPPPTPPERVLEPVTAEAAFTAREWADGKDEGLL